MKRLILAALLLAGTASAQGLPDRPLRVVVGYAAGGTGDLVARLLVEAMGNSLGQRPVVENRTGANGYIGAEAVARGPADGTAVLECPMGMMSITPELPGAVMPIDPRTELVPIANFATASYVAVTGARSPYRSMEDVLGAARAHPGTITYGSAGTGSAQHLNGARLEAMAGVRLIHVPYRGAAPAAVDVIAGRTDLLITNVGDVVRQIQGGELRALALGDREGVPAFANVPRLSDTLPGFEVVGWYGLWGPKGMTPGAIQAWAGATERALQNPVFRQRLQENGLAPAFEGPDAFAARIAGERQVWGEVIRRGNIHAN